MPLYSPSTAGNTHFACRTPPTMRSIMATTFPPTSELTRKRMDGFFASRAGRMRQYTAVQDDAQLGNRHRFRVGVDFKHWFAVAWHSNFNRSSPRLKRRAGRNLARWPSAAEHLAQVFRRQPVGRPNGTNVFRA